jgi:hypothetical protein
MCCNPFAVYAHARKAWRACITLVTSPRQAHVTCAPQLLLYSAIFFAHVVVITSVIHALQARCFVSHCEVLLMLCACARPSCVPDGSFDVLLTMNETQDAAFAVGSTVSPFAVDAYFDVICSQLPTAVGAAVVRTPELPALQQPVRAFVACI